MASVWKVLEAEGAGLHRLLVRLTVRGEVAEELMQELFLKLSGSKGFREARDGAAYARRVAINLAMDWRRGRLRMKRVGPMAVEPADGQRGPAGAVEEAEEIERILNAAGGLSELMREAFVLRYVQGESYERVGVMLGKTAQQARGLCHAAVKQVRERLKEREVMYERSE